MSRADLLPTLSAVWPCLKRAVVIGQLFRPHCELTQPLPDILCEYNVKVPIADGIVLTANVFRSRKAWRKAGHVPGS